jgi:hypothetical protein
MEKEEWRSFRKALDKEDRKVFDDMFDISISYISASVYSAKYEEFILFSCQLFSITINNYWQCPKNQIKQSRTDLLIIREYEMAI